MNLNPREIQEARYSFPYHHLPTLREGASVTLARVLDWGLEYLTYLDFARRLILELRLESLLDVGCGDRRLLSELKGFVPRLVGVDLSWRATLLAKVFCRSAEIVSGPMSAVRGQFDVVSCIETLEHVPDEETSCFLKVIRARLKPRGHALSCVPTTLRPVNLKHWRHYDEGTLLTTLDGMFRVERIHWLYRLCWVERIFKTSLANRLFVLRNRTVKRVLWRLHQRFTYFEPPGAGTHLMVACSAGGD